MRVTLTLCVGKCSDGGLAALQSADHILDTIPPVADFSRDPVSAALPSAIRLKTLNPQK